MAWREIKQTVPAGQVLVNGVPTYLAHAPAALWAAGGGGRTSYSATGAGESYNSRPAPQQQQPQGRPGPARPPQRQGDDGQETEPQMPLVPSQTRPRPGQVQRPVPTPRRDVVRGPTTGMSRAAQQGLYPGPRLTVQPPGMPAPVGQYNFDEFGNVVPPGMEADPNSFTFSSPIGVWPTQEQQQEALDDYTTSRLAGGTQYGGLG